MDSRSRNIFVLVLVGLITVAGAAAFFMSGGPAGASDPPAGTIAVVGVVVAVDSGGLTDVRGFTLRTTDGELRTFGLADLRNGVEFPPSHLAEHQLTASPVRVWYRPGDDPPQAIRLEDAT